MPIINRKRRAQAEPEPSPPPTRRRKSPSVSEASSIEDDVNEDPPEESQGGSSHGQMVKKLVRLALASEYSRQPIRRTDITAKVMAPNTGRQFKHVFNEAQEQLRSIFGMGLTELPSREKVTVSQKRAAQRSGTQSTSSSTSKAYILTSTLPIRYRHPKILPPPKIPSAAAEASYVGLVTFVLSLIYLSPARTISESRLEKHLRRMNADNYVLNGEKTEKVLKRMEKEGYVSKVRERDGGGEETVDYVLGSRGKVEVGERGVAGLVRKVYGKKDAEAEELDKRLVRSLGDIVIDRKRRPVDGEVEEEEEAVVDGEQEVEEEVQEEPTGRGNRKKQTPTQPKPTRGSSGRARNRGRDEIEVEVEEAEEEGEEGEEDAEEDVAEEDDEEESDE